MHSNLWVLSCLSHLHVEQPKRVFAVIERVGEVAHELLLPASMGCIHHVSHVVPLQMYKDGGCPASPPPAVLSDDEEECETQQALAGEVMWQEDQHQLEFFMSSERHGACTQWMAFWF